MKFGENYIKLQDKNISNYYINYELLKKHNFKVSYINLISNYVKSILHRKTSFFYEEESKFLLLFLKMIVYNYKYHKIFHL
jgi:hypothetical protein